MNERDEKWINSEFMQKKQESRKSESKLPNSFYFLLPYLQKELEAEMLSLKVTFTPAKS